MAYQLIKNKTIYEYEQEEIKEIKHITSADGSITEEEVLVQEYLRTWVELNIFQNVLADENKSYFQGTLTAYATTGENGGGVVLGREAQGITANSSHISFTDKKIVEDRRLNGITTNVAAGETGSRVLCGLDTAENNPFYFMGSSRVYLNSMHHNLNGNLDKIVVTPSGGIYTEVSGFNFQGRIKYQIANVIKDGAEQTIYFNETFKEEFTPLNNNRAIIPATADNFNDEQNAAFTYNVTTGKSKFYSSGNFMGISDDTITSIQTALSFDGVTADIAYRNIPVDNTSYTFEFTEAEREKLRQKAQGSNNVPIYYLVKTTRAVSGETVDIVGKTERVLTIVGSMPTLAPVVEDGNAKTAELTGDINTFIKYHSQAVYAINATASKGATITYQQISCGSKSNTSPYGSIDNVESGSFLFTVADSRNNIASTVLEKNFIDYVKLTSNVDADNPTTDGVLKFTIKGNYYNGSFGVADNSLEVSYRYKTNNGDYGEWVTVTPTIKNNTYSINVTLTGFDYQNTYTLQARAIDKLNTINSIEYKLKTIPVFDWSGEDFNFNVPVAYTDENQNNYSITDAAIKVANINSADLNKLSGLMKSLTNRYELDCSVEKSTNYSSVDVSLFLYGNTVRGYMTATRNEDVAANNVPNELVCQVEFDSGKKITGFGAVAFGTGTAGGVASFQITDTAIYQNDGSVSEEMVGKGAFSIRLCATATAGKEWNAYFTFPVLLDLTKY